MNKSKCEKSMETIIEVFKEITSDDMELNLMFQEHDDDIDGSEDEITLFVKDKKTKESRGINLTYYFQNWNNASKK